MRLIVGLVLSFGLFACGSTVPPDHEASVDAGASDGGEADAGVIDAGTVEDAGPQDAGVVEDGGVDAGPIDLPDAGPADAGDPQADQTLRTLHDLTSAYQAFFRASLRWPHGSGYWQPIPQEVQATTATASVGVAPTVMSPTDTALFIAPAAFEHSRAVSWQGPFLIDGTSLGDPQWRDGWGNTMRYAYLHPMIVHDHQLNRTTYVPSTIALWSIGADGLDQTGCTETAASSCSVDLDRILTAQASSDDLLVLVPDEDQYEQVQFLLESVAGAFRLFHDDTGFWPFADTGWSPEPGFALPEISPSAFRDNDTALLQRPEAWASTPDIDAHWNGSYLWPDLPNLSSAVDPWGHSLLFAFIRPNDGWGGGIAHAPDGLVVVWSPGPDGIDETGCSTGACAWNTELFAEGSPSSPLADDVVRLLGPP